jgi:hypothetical protein
VFSLLVWGLAGALVAVRRFAREATDEEGGTVAPRFWRRTTAEQAL